VLYGDDDLEVRLVYFLEHEEQRRRLAAAARMRGADWSFAKLWANELARLEQDWPVLQERCRQRAERGFTESWDARVWQSLGCKAGVDPDLVADLAQAALAHPDEAAVHNALGLASALACPEQALAARAAAAVGSFRRALDCDPAHVVAGLNLAEALAASGQPQAAAAQAQRTLATLDQQPNPLAPWLDAGLFALGYGELRVEWERAAWLHAGNPQAEGAAKGRLLRWRLHLLAAQGTEELSHAYEAVLARPDLAPGQALLGHLLSKQQQPARARAHFREALAARPFDLDLGRALFQALGNAGDGEGQRRLARDWRLLRQAAPELIAPEPWIMNVPPVGDELTSLIILCCNELDYTRRCLESVIDHTRPPYELILVDNGSTDGTANYLKEFAEQSLECGVAPPLWRSCPPGENQKPKAAAKRHTPQRVHIIRNEENRGFPAGCNQGLAQAKGRYLVLLNNDTVVTPGWLEGLIGWALHDWPQVGLVGPTSNYAPPPQQVTPAYEVEQLTGLSAFAAQRRSSYAGQALHTERLTGFCLLVRREVFERIGILDERFGSGFFDDDDLCLRARQAGFQLLVARNVYIHHFGSRTFKGLGIDCRQQLRANFAQFQAKWGAERTAGYQVPEELPQPDCTVFDVAAVPVSTAARAVGRLPLRYAQDGRPRKTLCMIVKNEEHNLAACLESVRGLFDEIIIVDTGSTDRTREIARACGATVIDFRWCDSFAAARNEGLRHATGDWIFWLDADDRLPPESRPKLQRLLDRLGDENLGYVLPCVCPGRSGVPNVVQHVRLFRNHQQIRWTYRVHEQIQPAIKALGGASCFTDIAILHTGYTDAALLARKQARDLHLLELAYAEQPHDPFILFNLGNLYLILQRAAEGLPLLRKSLARSQVTDSIVRKLHALIVQCHRQLGQPAEALAACACGRRDFPLDAELLSLEAELREPQGQAALAEQCLLTLLRTRETDHFNSVPVGLHSFLTRHKLAHLYLKQGRHAEAAAQWEQALAETPDFEPAWQGLEDLYLAQHRWADLERILQHYRTQGQPVEASCVQARAHLARREFPDARRLVEQAIAAAPRALRPRVLRSHVLLQEGCDPAAAAQALRDILELEPTCAEARQNLERLQQRQVSGGGSAPRTLAGLYAAACRTPSDIYEHCPTLYALAKECRHVTEFGTRTGVSTTALLYAQPEVLVCYDRRQLAPVAQLQALAGRTQFVFHQADDLTVDIDETDLLFIDTWHVYEQLQAELRRHAGKVRRYLVLHDTTTFGEVGETPGHQGLWPAVEEFLRQGSFRLRQRYANNHGLTVLEAV
jgi:GT2 family glycosyltransferase